MIDPGYCKLKTYNPKLGMDSLEIEALASRLSKSFDLEVNPTILFLRNNLQDLQEYCAEEVCEPNQAAPAEAPAPAKAARARRPGVLPLAELHDLPELGASCGGNLPAIVAEEEVVHVRTARSYQDS